MLVSVNSQGNATAKGNSYAPAVSADGRFVAFGSTADDLVANDTNGKLDVFVRDLKQGTTTLVSVNQAGTGSGDNDSYTDADISTDGRYVLFESNASNLVPNDTNSRLDVFVRDLQTQKTTLVSINRSGMPSSGGGFNATMSNDGRFVTFVSYGDDLVASRVLGGQNVFVRDLANGTTVLASPQGFAPSGDLGGEVPVISANGQFVAFGGYPRPEDVFVYDVFAGTTSLISVTSTGTGGGNANSLSPVISPNGRFVAFRSIATNLVPGGTPANNAGVMFVRDRQTGTTMLLNGSSDNNSPSSIQLLDNGTYVFTAGDNAARATPTVP